MKTHVPTGAGTACNSHSWAAINRVADCKVCETRVDLMIEIVRRVARGECPQSEAMYLMKVMGYQTGEANVGESENSQPPA
jgi:hypothetical protein